MELIILAAIILIWLIFAYEFMESNPKKNSKSKILTADEASSNQDDIDRARSILRNLKSPEAAKEPEKVEEEEEEILPDPFSDNNT